MNTQAELMQNARILGATHYRIYYTNTKMGMYRKEQEPFSYHFFDESDEEVCYFIVDMLPLFGLFIFEDSPRVWSKDFKLHENYSEPLDFRTLCMYHKFTKTEIRKQMCNFSD